LSHSLICLPYWHNVCLSLKSNQNSPKITESNRSERTKTVLQLGLGTKSVISVNYKEKAISVVNKLNRTLKNPVITAVPVVDDNDKIVGTFSASNLRVSTNLKAGF
jgi:CBS-domain-containing membrane protein